jgi:molybdate transport system substrate-binding protein
MRFNPLFSLGGALLMGVVYASAQAETLRVAAAADLAFVLPEINQRFSAAHPGVEFKVSLGSSGNFYAQIQNGAPFQVFMSADEKYPRELIAKGFAVADSYRVYGTGRIALWTLKPEFNLKQGLAALTDARVTRVAIANPAHAPYGRAAEAALNKYGIWNQLQPKLVLGENIAQTAQFVQSGNVDAGIVAVSLLSGPTLHGVGRWVELPANLYPPLVQAAVLTRAGASSELARQYVAYLGSADARVVLQRFGFVAPK